MPNIKPISDLRNYTDVLKEVDTSKRVYLTRNGHGEYGILTMDEIDELDRMKAAYTLFVFGIPSILLNHHLYLQAIILFFHTHLSATYLY